ncbi:hypothetical protein SDJN02_09430, partial [Cucurbita argyrosperma subsp. argyrosperma]
MSRSHAETMRERKWSGSCPEAEERDGDFATFLRERERERETVIPYDHPHRPPPASLFRSSHFPLLLRTSILPNFLLSSFAIAAWGMAGRW